MRNVRVAALYDVHGNLPALEAVLSELERARVETIVVGGDVLWGPQPAECLRSLRSAGARFIAGNCERDALQPESDADRWCNGQLGDAERGLVRSWPRCLELEVEGLGHVLFCHATPSDDEKILTRLTPDEVVADALDGVVADLVVCGHTHVQFDRRPVGAPRLVNAGSVGLPYEGSAGAFWTLLGRDVERRRTEYDVDEALRKLRSAGFPSFDEVFERSLRGLVTAESATEEWEERRRRGGDE